MPTTKHIKRGLSVISIILSICCSCLIIYSSAFAANNENYIKIFIDGTELNLDTAPVIVSGRTLVPLRAIFESLGAKVSWNSRTKTVIGTKDENKIELTINKKNAYINGKATPIDVPAVLISNRTYVPARFVAESLGTYVEWNSISHVIEITTPKVINFPDANLEALIRSEIKKPSGDILNTDVKNISRLNAFEKNISNIHGLEYLISLKELNLDINQITDISPLSKLTNLQFINLAQNQVSDISPIKNLKKLEVLNLWSNPIMDISFLKSMTSLKMLFLFSSKGDNINEAYEKHEKLLSKANEVISLIIKPEMNEYEKELAIHDYLVTHIKYDKQNFINDSLPDETHTAYGALVNGIAVCDGYARAFQILLDKVGIESKMVVGDFDSLYGNLTQASNTRKNGDKWKHAWNIVKVDGRYYQVDVTADDPLSDDETETLSHQYFNLSDKQMGSDHKWDRICYSKCDEDSILFNLIGKEIKNLIITDDKYYYIRPEGGIISTNHDGSSQIKLVQDKAFQIIMLGEYIYYINNSDGNTLYKVKYDGTSKTKLGNVKVMEIDKSSNNIYYIANYNIYKVDQDGNNQSQLNYDDVVSWILVENNEIYYKIFNFDYGAKLKRADLNGGNSVEIVSDEPTGFVISDNGINVKFYYAHNEHILDGWMYYINKNDSMRIYRVKIDGTEKYKISDDSVENTNSIEIVGKYVYYKNFNDGNKYYRINIDGTNKKAL